MQIFFFSGGDRKWTIAGCDGLPYVLGSRLIERNAALQNIAMTPGPGHFEINMVRCVFKLLWKVLLIDVAKLLNFSSPKALEACQKAFDHHKSWQILIILFFGTVDELLLPFVRECMAANKGPSLQDFYLYLNDCQNPNYLFMKDMMFTALLALIIFRTGVRRNHSDMMLAGRLKFSSLFFGTNMSFYQEISFRDAKCRVLQPDPVKDFWALNESFSISGHPSKGEGGDFVLESKNKTSKQFMPCGLPDERRWLRSIRNLDKLKLVIT